MGLIVVHAKPRLSEASPFKRSSTDSTQASSGDGPVEDGQITARPIGLEITHVVTAADIRRGAQITAFTLSEHVSDELRQKIQYLIGRANLSGLLHASGDLANLEGFW